MLDLSAIIARIKAECPTLRRVGGSADLDAALESALITPAAFVIPGSAKGGDDTLIGRFVQPMHTSFTVILALQNSKDVSGQGAVDALHALRKSLFAAINGWVPDDATGEPVIFDRGALLKFEIGQLWWGDDFTIKTYWSNSP